MSHTIINNRSMRRYELPISDDAAAVVYYSVENGRIVLRNTEVPSKFRGQGYGTRLAREVFDMLRAEGPRVSVACPFMALFAARDPVYAAMLDG